MWKCVFGSPEAVGEEVDEESCGVGGEVTQARRAAMVWEAAVLLWTEHCCIVLRVLKSPLGVRVGQMMLSMVIVVQGVIAVRMCQQKECVEHVVFGDPVMFEGTVLSIACNFGRHNLVGTVNNEN
jgi:hypothetical protein